MITENLLQLLGSSVPFSDDSFAFNSCVMLPLAYIENLILFLPILTDLVPFPFLRMLPETPI